MRITRVGASAMADDEGALAWSLVRLGQDLEGGRGCCLSKQRVFRPRQYVQLFTYVSILVAFLLVQYVVLVVSMPIATAGDSGVGPL